MDIRLSDDCRPNVQCQILTCIDIISRRVKWTLGNRQARGPECIFHFSCYLFSDTHLLINSCSVHNASVNLLINIYSLLFVPYCLSISVSLSFSAAFPLSPRLSWRWTHSRAVFPITEFPLQWRSSQLEHHLASPSQKHRIADATVPSDRWIAIAAHSSGSFMAAGKCIRKNLKISCRRTEKTSWKEKKLSKSILASIYYALSSGLYSLVWRRWWKVEGAV